MERPFLAGLADFLRRAKIHRHWQAIIGRIHRLLVADCAAFIFCHERDCRAASTEKGRATGFNSNDDVSCYLGKLARARIWIQMSIVLALVFPLLASENRFI